MAEFAIVVPVLLLVLMGIMQLGVVYNNWVTLTDAARAGARKAAVCRSGCSPDATTATVNAVKNSAADLNQSSLSVSVTSAWAQQAKPERQIRKLAVHPEGPGAESRCSGHE